MTPPSAAEAIVSLDGQATPDPQALASMLARKRPGDTASITLKSPSGRGRTVDITLGRLPGE